MIEADRDIKVVIVRGATPVAFSAGADIAEFEEVHATTETAGQYDELIREAYHALHDLDRPTIAMISGICYGGGCALALSCDLRYADETAKFCIPPTRLGLVYTLLETKRLYDLVGPSRTKEMLMGRQGDRSRRGPARRDCHAPIRPRRTGAGNPGVCRTALRLVTSDDSGGETSGGGD